MDLDDEELKVTRMMNGADRNSRVRVNKDIEVNDYVRINMDNRNCIGIGRVSRIVNETIYVNMNNKYNLPVSFQIDKIVKHSKQLIDLIEVGDIVNGREVKHIAMFEGFPDYPKLIFVDETHLIPDDTCENDEIRTILTKEQFEANCYKVGGE